MGYDLHITRADQWPENAGREIARDEWFALVAGDPELTLDPVNGDEFALWSGRCEHPEPCFHWWRGNISTKNPDRPMIVKMIQVARNLGARVQGDDGEEYKGTAGGRLVLRFKSVVVGEVVDAYWTERLGHGVFRPAPGKHDDPAMSRFLECTTFSKAHHAQMMTAQTGDPAVCNAFADVLDARLLCIVDQSGAITQIGNVYFIDQCIWWTPAEQAAPDLTIKVSQ